MVERQLPKLNVAGSIPVSRSKTSIAEDHQGLASYPEFSVFRDGFEFAED